MRFIIQMKNAQLINKAFVLDNSEMIYRKTVVEMCIRDSSFGDSKTNSAALAQILAKDYNKAKNTLANVERPDAYTDYCLLYTSWIKHKINPRIIPEIAPKREIRRPANKNIREISLSLAPRLRNVTTSSF